MKSFLITLAIIGVNAQFTLLKNSLRKTLGINDNAELSNCQMAYEGWLLAIICTTQLDNRLRPIYNDDLFL